MRPRRFGARRRPPPPDPYIEERIVEEGPLPPRRLPENPWIWIALLAVGVVAAVLLVIAVATGEDEPERRVDPPAVVAMPLAVGADHARAAATIEALGLVADTFPVESDEPAGRVTAQFPAAGTELRRGEIVRLEVSLGPDELADLAVPDVTGPPGPVARARAREAGFTVRTLYREAPTREEVGEVLLQRPAAGARALALSQITVFVGRG